MMPGLGVINRHALKSIVFINLWSLKTVGKSFRRSWKSPSILHKFSCMNSVVAPCRLKTTLARAYDYLL